MKTLAVKVVALFVIACMIIPILASCDLTEEDLSKILNGIEPEVSEDFTQYEAQPTETNTETGVDTDTHADINTDTDSGDIVPEHIHIYDRQIASLEHLKAQETYTEGAVYYYSCECGDNGTDTFTMPTSHIHVYRDIVDIRCIKSEATYTQRALYYKSCICGAKGTETFEHGGYIIPEGLSFREVSEGYEVANYSGNAEMLIIPMEYEGKSVIGIGANAFDESATLKAITMPNSIKWIGDYAFCACRSLESITIPDNVESIGALAFAHCTKLLSVTLGSGVKSISDGAFSCCTELASITIPDNVDSIGRQAFNACTGLVSVTLGDVECIGDYAFGGCTSLTSLILGQGVETIGYWAFEGCTRLSSLTIPDSVWKIENYAFNLCTSIESIEVSPRNTSYFSSGNCLIQVSSKTLILACNNSIIPNDDRVNRIGVMAFHNCRELTSIVIPDNITSIDNSAFKSCKKLTRVKIGDGVQSIGNEVFYNCGALMSITIGSNVSSIGYNSFDGCYRLVEIYNLSSMDISAGTEDRGNIGYYALGIYSSEDTPSKLTTNDDGYVFFVDSDRIYLIGYMGSEKTLTLPDGYGGLNYEINKYAFFGSDIAEIIIPDKVTKIGVYAFTQCNIGSIVIPESVTSIGAFAFMSCRNLTSIVFEDTETWYGTDITNWTNQSGGTVTDLSDSGANAAKFRETERNIYWYKK